MWRKKVDKSLKPFLEKYIEETHRYRTNFEKADDKGRAQVWIAIALLSRQLYNLEIKMNYLERALKDVSSSKEGEKFIKEVEKKVKKPGKKELKNQETMSREVPVINLGYLPEDKIEKESSALGESAEILSEIAKGKKKVKKKSRKKGKKRKKK
jgi:hypothetical protein